MTRLTGAVRAKHPAAAGISAGYVVTSPGAEPVVFPFDGIDNELRAFLDIVEAHRAGAMPPPAIASLLSPEAALADIVALEALLAPTSS